VASAAIPAVAADCSLEPMVWAASVNFAPMLLATDEAPDASVLSAPPTLLGSLLNTLPAEVAMLEKYPPMALPAVRNGAGIFWATPLMMPPTLPPMLLPHEVMLPPQPESVDWVALTAPCRPVLTFTPIWLAKPVKLCSPLLAKLAILLPSGAMTSSPMTERARLPMAPLMPVKELCPRSMELNPVLNMLIWVPNALAADPEDLAAAVSTAERRSLAAARRSDAARTPSAAACSLSWACSRRMDAFSAWMLPSPCWAMAVASLSWAAAGVQRRVLLLEQGGGVGLAGFADLLRERLEHGVGHALRGGFEALAQLAANLAACAVRVERLGKPVSAFLAGCPDFLVDCGAEALHRGYERDMALSGLCPERHAGLLLVEFLEDRGHARCRFAQILGRTRFHVVALMRLQCIDDACRVDTQCGCGQQVGPSQREGQAGQLRSRICGGVGGERFVERYGVRPSETFSQVRLQTPPA
jgi:hypothetical protein